MAISSTDAVYYTDDGDIDMTKLRANETTVVYKANNSNFKPQGKACPTQRSTAFLFQTDEEHERFRGYDPRSDMKLNVTHKFSHKTAQAIPYSVDYRAKNVLAPIKRQV